MNLPIQKKSRYRLSSIVLGKEIYHNKDSRVYLAEDRRTNKKIVVKEADLDYEFYREIGAAKILSEPGSHEHLLPLLDYLISQRYLIFPYMDKGNLFNYRWRRGGLTPEEAYPLLKQVGVGLDYCHSKGIIHNDLKTPNVLLCNDGREINAKIADFGLCLGVPNVEDIPNECGTKEYMAPEKYRISQPITKQVDIFSLGVMLHELLVNFCIYDRNSKEKPNKGIIPPHQKIPDLVLPIIRTACEIDPANRYQSAAEMVKDLEQAVYAR